MRKLIALVVLALAVFGAVVFYLPRPSQTFAQYPGFDAYFAANPPAAIRPDAAERALLQRHRPRFFLPNDHAGLIGFYDDYIAQGRLEKSGKVIARNLTQAVLNRYKNDPSVTFIHEPDLSKPQRPRVFARIDRSSVVLQDRSEQLIFLTYHAVFRHSGLPAGLAWWQSLPMWLFGDLNDWHQLDHYTAATLVLDAAKTPFALMLQQHNYLKTYLLGEGIDLPADGRPVIDVAIRSNELYPHQTGRHVNKAVRFIEPKALAYLLGAGNKPFLAAPDITDPAKPAAYELAFLKPSDAFYTFKGFLGERRRLPGRTGPPGANYNTLPWLKPLERQLTSGYWRPGHKADIRRFRASANAGLGAFLSEQAKVFWRNVSCLRLEHAVCNTER